jgi:hypothetical protein
MLRRQNPHALPDAELPLASLKFRTLGLPKPALMVSLEPHRRIVRRRRRSPPLREIEPPYRTLEKDWRGFDRGRLIRVLNGIVTGAEIEPVPC